MGFFSSLGLSVSKAATRTYEGITTSLARTLGNRSPQSQQRQLGNGNQSSPYSYNTFVIDPNDAKKKPNIAIINDWIVPSTLGWTLEALQAAVLGLENGNLYAAHSLMLAMTRDATVGHALRTYNLSLSALEWEIQWPRSIPEVARQSLMKRWPDAVTPQDLATASSYQVMLGLAPATQLWSEQYEDTGEKFWQFRMEVLESGHLQFRPDLRQYYFIARDGYREICDDGNTWTLFKSLGDRRHHLDSAVRTLATLWFIVQEAIRYHRAYNAEYGRPIKGLMVPDQMRLTEDVAGLVEQASGLYGGSVIILPQFDEGSGQASFDLKLIEAKSRGYATFLDLAEVARKLITLYLVGVLDTTQSGAGSHGKATAQEKVAERYLTAGARVREDAINRVLRRWAEFNNFDEPPRYVVKTSPPEDAAQAADVAGKRASALKSTMEALSKMKDMGVTVTEEKVERWASRVAGVDLKQRAVGQALAPTIHESSAEAVERATDTVMVCWEPPAAVARAMAVPGGEPWDELHVTLALCPAGSVVDVIAAVVAWSGGAGPVEGFLTGSACWPAGGVGWESDGAGVEGPTVKLPVREPRQLPAESEGAGHGIGDGAPAVGKQPVPVSDKVAKGAKQALTWLGLSAKRVALTPGGIESVEDDTDSQAGLTHGPPQKQHSDAQLAYVALADVPGLADLRARLVVALEAGGIEVKQDHGFIPHMTRAYLPAGSRVDAPGSPVSIDIDTVSVWAVGGRLRVPVRLSGAAGEVGDMPEPPEGVPDGSDPEQPEDSVEDEQADEKEAQPEPNPVADEEDDKALDSDIDELESQINSLAYTLAAHNMAVHELRTYQRARNGQFGSGGGIGSAAHGHSAAAKETKSVGAHRTAARAHVAVARRLAAKGDKEKAAEHLAIAKGHRDDANKLKAEAKAGLKTEGKAKVTVKKAESAKAVPKAETKTEHKETPKVEHKPHELNKTVDAKQAQTILKQFASTNKNVDVASVNKHITEVLGKEHDLSSILNAYSVKDHVPEITAISTRAPTSSVPGTISISLNVKDKSGNVVATTSRTILKNPDGTLHARQGTLFMEKSGTGLGPEIVKNNFAFYEKAGVKSASLDATDVGRYVWAKMGFTASHEEMPQIRSNFEHFLKEKGDNAHAQNMSISDIASHKYGKEFLTSDKRRNDKAHAPTWHGEININRSDPGYQQMQAYLGRSK